MNQMIEAMVRTDTPGDVGSIDSQSVSDALRQIHDRFVEERTNGWTHPETGQWQAPVSPEAAEQRWQAVLPHFQRVLLKTAAGATDPANRQLRLSRGALPASSDYTETEPGVGVGEPMNPAEYDAGWREGSPQGRSDRAAASERSLQRGESKSRQMINKLLA
jgi:hypothetical protein